MRTGTNTATPLHAPQLARSSRSRSWSMEQVRDGFFVFFGGGGGGIRMGPALEGYSRGSRGFREDRWWAPPSYGPIHNKQYLAFRGGGLCAKDAGSAESHHGAVTARGRRHRHRVLVQQRVVRLERGLAERRLGEHLSLRPCARCPGGVGFGDCHTDRLPAAPPVPLFEGLKTGVASNCIGLHRVASPPLSMRQI